MKTCHSLMYSQLILAVMRDFSLLSHVISRSDAKKVKSTVEKHSEKCRYNLVNLIFELSYEISEIRNLRFTNLLQSLARVFLRHSRSSNLYDIDFHEFDHFTNHIAKRLLLMTRFQLFDSSFSFIIKFDTVKKFARWNRSRDKQYQRDKKYLYLDIMYNYDFLSNKYLISLTFQWDFFVSFFDARFLYSIVNEQKSEKFFIDFVSFLFSARKRVQSKLRS